MATISKEPRVRIVLPTTTREAVEALAELPRARLLAGGTDLMVDVNLRHHRPEAVVALRRVESLAGIDDGRVGAGVTYDRLEREPRWPALAQAARTVGSPQIRAAGTLGGNLGTASPAGDTLPFLAAVDARIVLVSPRGHRRLRWDEFLIGPKRTALADDELIEAVELGQPPRRQAFGKVGPRQAMAIAIVNCCVVRDDDGTTRVALGAVGPTVVRAREAESFVSSLAAPTAADLDEFARLVVDAIAPIDDHRATAAYRRHAAGVLARRTLERCLWS